MLATLLDLHDRQAKFADRFGDGFIMLRSLGVEQLCVFLVYAHEPAVSDHIGSEDCGEPSLNALCGHENRSLPGA